MSVTFDDDPRRAVGARHFAFKQVHRRRAHEVGDEQVGRRIVDVLGVPNCCTSPSFMTAILVAERHSLDLIVRHIDDGRAGR